MALTESTRALGSWSPSLEYLHLFRLYTSKTKKSGAVSARTFGPKECATRRYCVTWHRMLEASRLDLGSVTLVTPSALQSFAADAYSTSPVYGPLSLPWYADYMHLVF